jgi:hypothetical protein
MPTYRIRALSSAKTPPWPEQLAGRIAAYAASRPQPSPAAAEMAARRVVDSFAVALAAIRRQPVAAARAILAGDVACYSAARHAAGARILRQSERARRLVMADDPLRRLAASLACAALRNSAALRSRFLTMLTTL